MSKTRNWRKYLVCLMALALCAASLCLGAAASYSGADVWNGTSDDSWYSDGVSEFTISSGEQLAGLASLVNSGNDFSGKTITLEANIDLGGESNPWTPIGSGSGTYYFAGTFNGNGHTISGLYINNSTSHSYVGLFGFVSDGKVMDLHVSGSVSSESGSASNVGGVVGYNRGGTVDSCSFSGEVKGINSSIGGIVGYNIYSSYSNGSVVNCFSTGSVTASGHDSTVGGVVGVNSGATVSNCYNTGNVTESGGGVSRIGGVVGSNSGSVGNCYNIGNVTGDVRQTIGGVAGSNSSGITECFFLQEGSINSGLYGIGGYTGSGNKNASPMASAGFGTENSFTNWNFTNTWEMDEFFGRPVLRSAREDNGLSGSGTANDPFKIPNLATLEYYAGLINTGATYGDNDDLYSAACYEVTGTIDMSAEYGEGLGSWTPIGTSSNRFTGTFDGGENTISGLYINNIHSAMGLFGYVGAGGTVQDLTVSGAITVGPNNADARYIGGVVGDNAGTIDGCENRCTLTALNTYGGDDIGGVAGHNTGEIINCRNTGIISGGDTINNDMFYTGGIVGSNEGIVNGCINSGTVSGCMYIGGIAGRNNGENAEVSQCYNTNSVSGNDTENAAGGIVGQNQSSATVENCYNTGDVTGAGHDEYNQISYIGGIAGRNDGRSTVQNCYNTGSVSSSANGEYAGEILSGYSPTFSPQRAAENCYYSAESETETVSGVTGKTAEQFASGEVAWLLQGDQPAQIWGQPDRGTAGSLPELTSESDARVWQVEFTVDEQPYDTAYANNGGTVALPTEPTAPEGLSFNGWFAGDVQLTATTPIMANTTAAARFGEITVPVTDVTVSESELTLEIGGTADLDADVEPDNASNPGVAWTSSNTAVATVDANGVVTAVGPGTAVIRATADGVTAECTVTVRARPVNVPQDYYDIELIAGEGGEARTNLTNASAGSTISVSVTPGEGYRLAYITVDGERIDGTTFTMPAHDVTVRVYFAARGLPFTDVNRGDWFYEYVEYVYVNGMMDGVSDTLFDPDGNMTRAMVWAVLARLDGETVTGVNWAEDARAWAMTEGVSDGTDPNGLVTREQFATMLWRYAGSPAPAGNGISAFTDAASVSSWAVDAMNWALEQGIITGMGDGTLSPQGTATRAQAAAMLMRFVG